MAKAAKYDRQNVIDKATNLYWKKGFHATSMRNLQDEIDMRPGSIYAAFGNKDGLFKQALRHYTDIGLTQIQQLKQVHDSPMAVLIAFVKAQVIESQDTAPSGMCMLAKTIGELTEENQDLIDTTKSHLAEISAEFVKLIEAAQALGEVDKHKNAQDLAIHVQIQIAGLRTFAKINNDTNLLNNKVDDIFSHYPF
ncbi:TetR/AcrR family transcriptional regulator [Catenovulum maritimum]|uniref:TetR family transcriptional regulator n=1 Tax=Catenovulum maritimum TaxID=1513271 RepID=A0A0J8GRZ6_9ALTE|nr:TetR/AcrR family transcriptional regulator [Catenovulum maritimum]KMT64064.1 TetR family transcriptional regulator [Catenovulum maritimum]